MPLMRIMGRGHVETVSWSIGAGCEDRNGNGGVGKAVASKGRMGGFDEAG